MAMNTMNKEPERQDLEMLLPWHATGTLSRRDSDRIERALAADGELARQYALVREELAETIHLNESLGAPSARAMDKLFSAIAAEESRPPRRRPSFNPPPPTSAFLLALTPPPPPWLPPPPPFPP